ncbi:hypothetical protein Goarm_010347 [Gossypium armourianum]|uniref:Uncharacterized protein n=1 Tax=Gossypium armourianum TaxID=34283 RepID=A0A7J9JVS4_9ROSI|nr:hypothetical protein [Gossypium armourianum]
MVVQGLHVTLGCKVPHLVVAQVLHPTMDCPI